MSFLNQIVEKYAEYTKPLSIAFIECDKAIDSMETLAVMKSLRTKQIEEIYVKILEDTLRKVLLL